MVLSSALNRLAGTVYTHVTLSKRTIRKYARRAKLIETANAALQKQVEGLQEKLDTYGKLGAQLTNSTMETLQGGDDAE